MTVDDRARALGWRGVHSFQRMLPGMKPQWVCIWCAKGTRTKLCRPHEKIIERLESLPKASVALAGGAR